MKKHLDLPLWNYSFLFLLAISLNLSCSIIPLNESNDPTEGLYDLAIKNEFIKDTLRWKDYLSTDSAVLTWYVRMFSQDFNYPIENVANPTAIFRNNTNGINGILRLQFGSDENKHKFYQTINNLNRNNMLLKVLTRFKICSSNGTVYIVFTENRNLNIECLDSPGARGR